MPPNTNDHRSEPMPIAAGNLLSRLRRRPVEGNRGSRRVSQGPSPLPGQAHQRHGPARRGERGPLAEILLDAERPQLPRGQVLVRLAPNLRPHRGPSLQCPTGRRPNAPSRLRYGDVQAVLPVLHHGLAPISAPRAIAAGALPPLRQAGRAHRPHPVAVRRTLPELTGVPPDS